MVQLNIRFPNKAGSETVARRFPFRIGRSADADLRLQEPGVWERHARIELDFDEGFMLITEPGALAAVNGDPMRRTRLRNGDTINIGALSIQFCLGSVRQVRFTLREWLTWAGLAAVCGGQVALVYWLSR